MTLRSSTDLVSTTIHIWPGDTTGVGRLFGLALTAAVVSAPWTALAVADGLEARHVAAVLAPPCLPAFSNSDPRNRQAGDRVQPPPAEELIS